jgi:protein ImuB
MHWIALQPQPDPAQPLVPDLPDALAALGWWALQYTPKVARLEDALLLEVSASERLWGGRDALIRHVHASNKPLAHVKYAQGATSLVAFARLQYPALAGSTPDALPLASLVAARPHLDVLSRLGCTCWGQLRALPRAGVARRMGAPLLDALDRAYGLKPELYPWLVLPEVFEARLELSAQVETAPALLFGARRLLRALQVWLQLRQSGVLALALSWTMDARRHTASTGELVLRTAEPTLDTPHLERLLAEHLARITLPAPVLYLGLRTLETRRLAGTSASLLPEDLRPGDSLHQLLERLGARLGRDKVLHWQARADHRPEQMQAWQPVLNASQLIASPSINTWPGGLLPTWLLTAPLKLLVQHQCPQYQGPLTLLSGPQRIETGWWGTQAFALRDYFVARSAQSALLWIYRERLGGQGGHGDAPPEWYLHGVFA